MPDFDRFHSPIFLVSFAFVDVADSIKAIVKLGGDLTAVELVLFDCSNTSILQTLRTEAALKHNDDSKAEMNLKIKKTCSELIDMIDTCLLPFCADEDGVRYHRMYGCNFVVVAC